MSGEMQKLKSKIERSFNNVVYSGREYKVKAIPTGSLDLDYALGTGGWTVGHFTGIFGPRDIGKSSILGLSAMKNALDMALNVVFILLEGQVDEGWWSKLGVDPKHENLAIFEPDNGDEAFELLYESIHSGADLIVFDSVGALLGESEMEEDGKRKVGGQSGLITHWVKKCEPGIRKNGVCVLMLNQVRDAMNSQYAGMKEQPGGNALEHYESVIVQLKRGKEKFFHPEHKGVIAGEQIQAVIVRSKKREGRNQVALIDFYSTEIDGLPFGIDKTTDAINTGKRLGIIEQSGAYYTLPDGSRHQGAKKVGEYLDSHPESYKKLREAVLAAIVRKGGKLELEVIDGEA